MPNITIYLNDELYWFVKREPSKTIQEALKEYKAKHPKKKLTQQ